MKHPTANWDEYVLLRDEALMNIPDNIDVFHIKKKFETMITSKRRLERICTVKQLAKELERQMIIAPDKTGIHAFYKILVIVDTIHPQAIRSDLLTKVGDLAQKLNPAPLVQALIQETPPVQPLIQETPRVQPLIQETQKASNIFNTSKYKANIQNQFMFKTLYQIQEKKKMHLKMG